MSGQPEWPGDRSGGYDRIAPAFIEHRARSPVGVQAVREWVGTLAPGSTVLDLGCGSGEPVSRVLTEAGCRLWAIDASPTMVAAYRAAFPNARAECASVQESDFFGRAFDAVVAWGLMFLIDPADQRDVIRKVGRHLEPEGRFLFTAPAHATEWQDLMTGETSVSLGAAEYEAVLRAAGMRLIDRFEDEGENHYYLAERLA